MIIRCRSCNAIVGLVQPFWDGQQVNGKCKACSKPKYRAVRVTEVFGKVKVPQPT